MASTFTERVVQGRLKALAPLLQDPSVIEILLNEKRGLAYERLGHALVTDPEIRLTPDSLKALAVDLASHSGFELDTSASGATAPDSRAVPQLSAAFDGFRFEIQMPSVCLDGIRITIRRIPWMVRPLAQYVAEGHLPQAQADLLVRTMLDEEFVLIAGSTSSAKTSFLNTLIQCVPDTKHLLSFERVGELLIRQPIATPLDVGTHPSFGYSRGVASAMRSRPDYAFFGELRGPEGYEALDLALSGHGGATTLHAKNAQAALARWAGFCVEAKPTLPYAAHAHNLANAVSLVVLMERVDQPGGRCVRTVSSIDRVESYDASNQKFSLVNLYKRSPAP